MRLLSRRSVFCFLVWGTAACSLGFAGSEGQKPEQQAVVKAADEDPNTVGKIADYVITKDELEKRLLQELRPEPYTSGAQAKPVDADTVLKKMIAEKAMVMEARKHNYLQEETISAPIKRFRERKLTQLLLERYLQSRQGELAVTDSEIEQRLKTDPKLDRERARALVQRTKANRVLDQYYRQLYKERTVQKVTANFNRAAQIHQRLLYRPREPRKVGWIRNSQVRDELTPEEKNMVLATYKGGKVTLQDWFNALCDIVPPSRPKDLHTPQGVESLLDRALRMPIFVTEAESLGLDKDADFVTEVTEYEDRLLLGKMQQAKNEGIAEPNEQEIIAYFNQHQEMFGRPRRVKIDQIWCQDREAALKAKAELDSGKDFESVRQAFSLQKESPPFDASASGEGMFWDDLWKADPNQIVGPIKGFYFGGGTPPGGNPIKWRVVKVLEKTPAELKEYASDMEDQVKWRLLDEKRRAALAKYRQELLEKYPHTIYADRIKGIDPLDIP